MSKEIHTQVVVIGSGPAGYSAAFRAADLGLQTILVERYSNLGGVCLNVGCIPSKTLLHIAKVLGELDTLTTQNIVIGKRQINLDKIREQKRRVISQLTNGLTKLAQARKVNIVHGVGKFSNKNTLKVTTELNSSTVINFDHAIIAAGSSAVKIPMVPYENSRVWDSSDALQLKEVPGHLLIIGGGIIGLEIGTIYHALGSKIDLIEMCDQVIPSADPDIIKTFTGEISNKFHLMLETQMTHVDTKSDGLYVSMEGKQAPSQPQRYDAILVAVGRKPNSSSLDLNQAGVELNDRGFISVDKQMRTNVPHIFAIGDIVGQPMLAHKGMHEGHIAAEVISGKKYYFDPKAIPSISYTDPEVGWVGITEKEAKEQGICYEICTFPWTASGRAVASNCGNGMTKLIFDTITRRIIGGAVVGVNSGELLGEITLAIEMGCDAADIALTIHSHPTLHESIGLASQIFEGSITDLFNLKASKI
ncbi:Dihydrolipoyl dehydrogenase [Candidatus Erwinia haradaeae]|uniref:Dihydrolipoyl dehydrogenase n=1 Tax=Candidatus Erwinia haradaeae TaxID=1922217 RepID=A0A451CZ59_9GAMM|nr:dihydrolipoyl dehydrogenase [Candidatus Erwinia haradaeae]VFP78677.1 Dihydrolipoyl dehydrogenase [Candidatus Erwinia haradaeae]